MNHYNLRQGALYPVPASIAAGNRSMRHNADAGQSVLQRRRVAVQGSVQSTTFHFFVRSLAQRWHLAGFVLNKDRDAMIEVQGLESSIEGFLDSLLTEVPPVAHIHAINTEIIPGSSDENSFAVM